MRRNVKALVRPVAHRGLHNKACGIVENTLTAFEAAIARGYAIECDLQPARNLEPMVFHDDKLGRLTRSRGPVRERSPGELRKVRFKRTSDHIPTLSELLELTNGRVPLLIEIKSDWCDGLGSIHDAFAMQIARRLAAYKGDVGLMSFDPRRVAPFRMLLPDVPIGIVGGGIKHDHHLPSWIKHWTAYRLLRNDIVRPDFVNYSVRGLPGVARVLSKRPADMPLFTWTVRSASDRRKAAHYADAMVFEGFEPV